MIDLVFMPSEHGIDVRTAPPYELVAWYLRSDLQSSSTTQPVLENVRLVIAGGAEPVEWDGNGFVLIPGPRTCRIESLYDDDMVLEVPSLDMLSVLERWLAHKLERQGER